MVKPVTLRAPTHGEILVRVLATGICHTDVVVKQRGLTQFPVVLGHEGAGVVEEIGSGVSQVKAGDKVVMSYASCGSCSHCLHGKPSYCFEHGSRNFGGTRPDGSYTHFIQNKPLFGSFFQQSSFASHALVTENNIIKVNDYVSHSLPLHAMSPLGCGVQTGAGAVFNTLRARPGETIAVFGCGAVGLSAIMAAKASGCTTIVAVDVKTPRLMLAKDLGATHMVNPTEIGHITHDNKPQNSIVDIIHAHSHGGVHYALDTSGNPNVLRTAFESLRPLGVCGVIGGPPPNTDVKIDMLHLLVTGKSLRGVIQGDSISRQFIPMLLNLHKQGRFPFERLITYYDQGLDDINQAVEDCEKGHVIKPVLRLARE